MSQGRCGGGNARVTSRSSPLSPTPRRMQHDRDEDLAWLSLRNVPRAHVIVVDQLNAYDVLVNDDVVFTSAALQTYVDRGSPKEDQK